MITPIPLSARLLAHFHVLVYFPPDQLPTATSSSSSSSSSSVSSLSSTLFSSRSSFASSSLAVSRKGRRGKTPLPLLASTSSFSSFQSDVSSSSHAAHQTHKLTHDLVMSLLQQCGVKTIIEYDHKFVESGSARRKFLSVDDSVDIVVIVPRKAELSSITAENSSSYEQKDYFDSATCHFFQSLQHHLRSSFQLPFSASTSSSSSAFGSSDSCLPIVHLQWLCDSLLVKQRLPPDLHPYQCNCFT